MTEVVLRGADGALDNPEQIDQVQLFGGFAIGRFEFGGTGWVVKKDISNIVILTSAHVFMDMFKYSKASKRFLIGDDIYIATPRKNSIDWSNDSAFYTDPISGVPISVPEDWVLCDLEEIYCHNSSSIIVALEILEGPPDNKDVVVIGYPTPSVSYTYLSPSATKLEIETLVKNLRFGCSVCFSGKLLSESSQIICATCSSMNGMSGAPLLVKQNGIHKVIGLLYGSKASWMHYYRTRIKNSEGNQLLQFVQELKNFLIEKTKDSRVPTYYILLFEQIVSNIEAYLATNDEQILEITLDHLYYVANVLEEKSGNVVTYNTFISVECFKNHLN
jgi:hypothetical protein